MHLKKAIRIVVDDLVKGLIEDRELTDEQNEAIAYLMTIRYAPIDLSNLDRLIEQYRD